MTGRCRGAWPCLAVALTLGGCVQGPPAGDSTTGAEATPLVFGPARQAYVGCGGNCEPTAAGLPDGTVLVTSNCVGSLARAAPDQPFGEPEPVPFPPGTALQGRCDDLVQADGQGRVFFTALLSTPVGVYLAGIQVARSDDGGRTWASNIYLSAPTEPQATGADRQWLAFGEGDVVYLSHWHVAPPTGLWVARSDDAGETFGSFVRAVPTEERMFTGVNGAVQVDGEGRLLLPYFASRDLTASTGLEVWVAVSEDRGATWSRRPVGQNAGPPEPLCCAWPVAAADEVGRWHVLWPDSGGAILGSASDDLGASWGPPVQWNPGGTARWRPPALVASRGQLTAAWFELSDEQQSLWVGRGVGSAPPTTRQVALLNTTEPTTDFAYLARFPDGRVVLPWGDPDGGVLVAVED